jgi:acetyl esterase/lipase
VGSIDLFAREDIAYAERLTASGVPAELLVLPGAFHGFDKVMPGAWVSAAGSGGAVGRLSARIWDLTRFCLPERSAAIERQA